MAAGVTVVVSPLISLMQDQAGPRPVAARALAWCPQPRWFRWQGAPAPCASSAVPPTLRLWARKWDVMEGRSELLRAMGRVLGAGAGALCIAHGWRASHIPLQRPDSLGSQAGVPGAPQGRAQHQAPLPNSRCPPATPPASHPATPCMITENLRGLECYSAVTCRRRRAGRLSNLHPVAVGP